MSAGINYNQRDIVLIPFPYSDLTGSKQRPALILSNEKLNSTDDRICCLITSNKPVDGIFIAKKYFETGTLPFESWVKPQRLFTVHHKIIIKRLCTIREEAHEIIVKAVNEYIQTEKLQ